MSKTPEEMADIVEEWATNWERDLDDSDTILKQTHKAAAPQWISVKDRLPEPLQDVLIVYAPTNEARNDFRMECWNWPENPVHETQFVTHWMPLPEPPKEEK